MAAILVVSFGNRVKASAVIDRICYVKSICRTLYVCIELIWHHATIFSSCDFIYRCCEIDIAKLNFSNRVPYFGKKKLIIKWHNDFPEIHKTGERSDIRNKRKAVKISGNWIRFKQHLWMYYNKKIWINEVVNVNYKLSVNFKPKWTLNPNHKLIWPRECLLY